MKAIAQILLITTALYHLSCGSKKTELSDFTGTYTFIDAYIHSQEYKYLSSNYLGIGLSNLEYPVAKAWKFELYLDQNDQLSGTSVSSQTLPLSNIRLISDTLRFDISIPGFYSRSCQMFQDKTGKKWMSLATGQKKFEFQTLKMHIDSSLVITSNSQSFMRETSLNIDSINTALINLRISEIEDQLSNTTNQNEQSKLREAIAILKSKMK